jgi:hypothetical protein
MALELYTGFPAVIDGTSIGHSQNAEGDIGLKRMDIKGEGRLTPINYSEAFIEPVGSLETADLKSILDSGDIGINLQTGLVSTGNNIMQFQQVTDDQAFQSGSNHFTVSSTKAFWGIESISVAQDDDAPAMAKLFAHFMKGSGEPMIAASGQALTGTVALSDWYTLGPVYVNGTLIGGEMSVEIVTGVQFGQMRSGGEKRATKGRITAQQAECRLGIKNLTELENAGFGISAAAGDVDIYLRHNNDSGRTADASSAHILITFSAAKWDMRKLGSKQQGEVVFTPTLLNTGTVSVSVASPIPHA